MGIWKESFILSPSLCLLILVSGVSAQWTPLTIRFGLANRQFGIPLDAPVHSSITRVFIVDGAKRAKDINVTLTRAQFDGPYYHAHNFFELFPLKDSGTNIQFELQLKKPLIDKFKAHDQIVFTVSADDGDQIVKNELFGRIEEPRNPELVTVATLSTYPPTSPATTTSTTATTATAAAVQINNTTVAPVQEDGSNWRYLGLLCLILPVGFFSYFHKKIRQKCPCGSSGSGKTKDEAGRDPRGLEGGVSTQLSSSATEFTELPSRKTSSASSFFLKSFDGWPSNSTSPYEDRLLQTKDEGKDRWEFPRHHLKFYGILGEGCFGQVWKCEALNIDGRKGVTMVAVKTLKESASNKEKEDLVSELNLMKTLLTEPHTNVVRLLGCCTSANDKEPTYVIMEYVSKGKLQEFLRKSRAEHYYGNLHGSSQKLTSRDLTSFCYQVARGMEYLSSKKVIHRDLAARNILVSETNICKVADFGFSRDVMANNIYERKSEGRLPIRWMAPEALYDNVYTTKTDVWSFGVLMWEIVTLGSTPYPGMSGSEVMKRVREGVRLEKPEHCDREIYNMMFYCWDNDPQERPSFSQLVKDLESLLTQGTDYIDLNLFPEHGYYNEVSLSGERV